MTVTDSRAEIVTDAEAIEHAIHTGRLVNLGLRTDDEVTAAIAAAAREAEDVRGGVAALVAADYADNPEAFTRVQHAALFRATQLHHAEDQYPALTGADENGGTQHV